MEDAEFARGLEHFAFRLHNHFAQANPDQNVLCSPLSIRVAGGMLRMGATEESSTAAELDGGLQFSSEEGRCVSENFDVILDAYEECDILKMANRLYVMTGLTLNKQFDRIVESRFHSKVTEIDFDSDQASSVINGWVESETDELIKDLIGPGVLSAESRLVLVNAVHFKGEWAVKFNEDATKEEDFFVEPKKTTVVTMMNTTNNFFFGELSKLKATALRLDYNACNMAMLILLPDEKSSLPSLEKMLVGTTLDAITSKMTLKEVDVKIPKFHAEFQQELEDAFKLMGISRIFSDQSELGEILASRERISVSKIIHKAFIEVNEIGTEAAAATAVVITARSAVVPSVFHANRPFFYIIYDKVHGLLFVGRISTPPSGRSPKCKCGAAKPCIKCSKCKSCRSY